MPWIIGGIGLASVAWADLRTREIATSIFYLFVVAYAAWCGGLIQGIIFSLISTILWKFGDQLDRGYSSVWIGHWNAFVRFIIFATMTVLLVRLKLALAAAKSAQDAAEEATRAKSDFLANMSHEIRTPMNAILGMAELLARTTLTDQQRNHVDIFRREGRRLLDLINDILDLAKIEAGRYVVERTSFSLHRMIEEIASLTRIQADARGLRFDVEIDPGFPETIESDPILFRRIILNLVNNAVKFTEQGGIKVGVHLEENRHLRIIVEDTGIGIAPEVVATLFSPFRQADASITRRFGGTGLGLSLVRDFAELLGGNVRVESEVGRGSRFVCEIPFAPSDAAPPVAETATEIPIDDRPLRILLVEDYDVNRQIVRAFLSERPYRVVEAVNGREGLEKFQAGAFDLVLMDVQMPEMDGHEATRAIREWERATGRPATPIVALTAHAYEEDRRRSEEAGCNAHLVKPIDRILLLRTVHDCAVFRGESDGSDLGGPSIEKSRISDVVRKLRPKFLGSLAATTIELRAELDQDAYPRIVAIGHQLRGSAAMFGFPEIARLGEALESTAGRADREGTSRLVEELTAEAARIGSEERR
jgi:signal transduction histidine kinase/HPt (histidine-containing phosphotransfer) domain-containing protein